MFYDVDRKTITLNAEQFKSDSKTYALALVVSEEVEAQRIANGERGTTEKNKLAQLLLDPDSLGAANPKRWYLFITDMDLLKRCAHRLGLSRTRTIERIYKELSPPNWETLFWMHAFLENLGNSAKEKGLLEKRVHEAEKFAISSAAKKAAKGRHAKNHADKQQVFKWCDEHMREFKSMDDAALDIAETFIPQKFRTVRDWMTEWKKLRSAGKA